MAKILSSPTNGLIFGQAAGMAILHPAECIVTHTDAVADAVVVASWQIDLLIVGHSQTGRLAISDGTRIPICRIEYGRVRFTTTIRAINST